MVSFRFTAGYWFKGQAPQRQNAITFNIEQGIRENKSIKAIQDRLRARGLGYREERMRTDIQKARTIEWSKTHESYNRARAFHRAAREYQQEKGIRYYSESGQGNIGISLTWGYRKNKRDT